MQKRIKFVRFIVGFNKRGSSTKVVTIAWKFSKELISTNFNVVALPLPKTNAPALSDFPNKVFFTLPAV